MATSEDRVGNLLGQSPSSSSESIFLLGSHLDTVRNAGRFDGSLGVLLAIEAVDISRSANVILPFSLAVMTHTLDIRHQSDSVLNQARAWLEHRASQIARERRLGFTWEVLQVTPAKECDSALSRRLLRVVETVTGSNRLLPSGAGHDAATLASLFPVATLFVRCREGLSHHPDEFVSLADLSVALQVTVEFLRSWS